MLQMFVDQWVTPTQPHVQREFIDDMLVLFAKIRNHSVTVCEFCARGCNVYVKDSGLVHGDLDNGCVPCAGFAAFTRSSQAEK